MDDSNSISQQTKEAIIELKGELKLVHQKIDTIENNHLAHIQKDIDRISKVLYTIGFMILGQILYTITKILTG